MVRAVDVIGCIGHKTVSVSYTHLPDLILKAVDVHRAADDLRLFALHYQRHGLGVLEIRQKDAALGAHDTGVALQLLPNGLGLSLIHICMSTVPETMVCNYLGMKVLAVSCITNMATGIQTVKHSHARVLEIANQAGETLCRWLGAVIQKMEG